MGFSVLVLKKERSREFSHGSQGLGMIRPNHSASNSESLALQLFGIVCTSFSAQCVSKTMHCCESFRVFRAQDTSLCLQCLKIELLRFCVSCTRVESIRKIEFHGESIRMVCAQHSCSSAENLALQFLCIRQ